MRAVVQRVSAARVSVAGSVVGEIGPGFLVLLGAADGDGNADADALADKVIGLRIFADERGKMNRSVADVGGSILVVSQFTLLGDVRKGRRPSFTAAAPPEEAARLVDRFVTRVAASGLRCATGRFGEMMEVELVNDGPVTLVVDAAGGRVV
jgi:D-tyrosyl-tRNA(Tyr) deacylase